MNSGRHVAGKILMHILFHLLSQNIQLRKLVTLLAPIHPSIHPPSTTNPWSGRGGSHFSGGVPHFLFPGHIDRL